MQGGRQKQEKPSYMGGPTIHRIIDEGDNGLEGLLGLSPMGQHSLGLIPAYWKN